MKTLFTLTALALAISAQAQITITQADFLNWRPGTDSTVQVTAVPTLGTNASIDLTNAIYGNSPLWWTQSAYSSAAFPTATYSTGNAHSFSTLFYGSGAIFSITATGHQSIGEDMKRQAISISAFTNGANDSLIIDEQQIAYSAPNTVLPFPVTFGSKWGSAFNFTTKMTLKAASYGPTPFPASRKTFIDRKDTVIGWGRVRIKRADGTNSGWMDALSVKRSFRSRDSFFLNGSPAPTPMLSGFRLRQDLPDSSFHVLYYRKGEVTPLLSFQYPDSSFSVPDYVFVHQNRVPRNVGVPGTQLEPAVSLHPNPANAASGFDVDLNETSPGNWSYNLIDAAGRIVSSAPIPSTSGKAHIGTPEAAPGTYFLDLRKDGRNVATKPVVIKE